MDSGFVLAVLAKWQLQQLVTLGQLTQAEFDALPAGESGWDATKQLLEDKLLQINCAEGDDEGDELEDARLSTAQLSGLFMILG